METNTHQSVVLHADHQLALRQLNKRNRQFWRKRSKLFSKQFADEAVSNKALTTLMVEELLGLPVKNRQTLEKAVDDAHQEESRLRLAVSALDDAGQEESRTRWELFKKDGQTVKAHFREFSRKGGLAAKADFLNGLIQERVSEQPSLNHIQLLDKLISEGDVELDPADDETIIVWDDNEKGKKIPISGLKDRLFRAKKKIKLR